MRIIARSTRRTFWEKHADAEQPLKAWFKFASAADWVSPAAVKVDYRSASILKSGRAVFNICGNKFRLIAGVNYSVQVVYIKWVGTHAEYDDIDAEEV